MNTVRVLHVVPSYIPAYRYGGPIYSVHGLCKALSARNHDVHVFTTNVNGPNDSDVPLGTPVDIDGVNVWYFSSPLLRRLYWSPSMNKALKKRIKQFNLVHLHSIFLWPTWAGARAAISCGIPYVFAPRGMLVKDLVKRKSRLMKSVWIKTIERRNLEQAATIHVTSKAEERECLRFGFKLPIISIVPNGIDPTEFSNNSLEPSDCIKPLLDKQPMILFLSRITWKKGLDRLIPALAHVPDAHLIIAGNDEENYTPHLTNLANQHGVKLRITFSGPVRNGDKKALLIAAKVLILPSYSENFGNVVLEAMAVG
ncbi:MAG: glycosyltransferase, partial [Desulfobacterales bacterium]